MSLEQYYPIKFPHRGARTKKRAVRLQLDLHIPAGMTLAEATRHMQWLIYVHSRTDSISLGHLRATNVKMVA